MNLDTAEFGYNAVLQWWNQEILPLDGWGGVVLQCEKS